MSGTTSRRVASSVLVLEDWTPPRHDLNLYYPGRRNASAALRGFVALARAFARG